MFYASKKLSCGKWTTLKHSSQLSPTACTAASTACDTPAAQGRGEQASRSPCHSLNGAGLPWHHSPAPAAGVRQASPRLPQLPRVPTASCQGASQWPKPAAQHSILEGLLSPCMRPRSLPWSQAGRCCCEAQLRTASQNVSCLASSYFSHISNGIFCGVLLFSPLSTGKLVELLQMTRSAVLLMQ